MNHRTVANPAERTDPENRMDRMWPTYRLSLNKPALRLIRRT
ncbi:MULTISPECIES: hypothetical protein [Paenibacillus]|nr:MULTISPECIES: hypothetical protein [Paenibacillus]